MGRRPWSGRSWPGDAETGVSIIRLVEELDAGPIGAAEAFPIGPEDDAGAVFERAAGLAPELVEQALDGEFREQEGETTYAEKIGPADRELDWSRPAQELHDRIRALSPHIGARGELHGRPVLVWRSRLADGGSLELLEVQPEGRRRMTLDEFERGLRWLRRAALRTLVRVFDEGAYADRAFATEAAELDPRDRAFAQRLAYGSIQRVRTLDHALEQIGGRPGGRPRRPRPGRASPRGLRARVHGRRAGAGDA